MSFWSQVEAKVKAAAFGTLAASLLLALLNAVVGDSKLLGSLPAWAQFVLVTCAPTLVSFLAGYRARHVARAPVAVAPPAVGKHSASAT